MKQIPILNAEYDTIMTSKSPEARERWLMGRLKPMALGNMELKQLRNHVTGGSS